MGGASDGATGAQVAPVKTLVQDTLYRADGSAAQGSVTIRWNGFATSAGEAVAAGQMTVTTNANGGISIPLIANTGSTPSGSYYRVVIKLDDGTTSEEIWVVPAATTTTVAAIRAKVVPQAVAAQFVSRDYVDSSLATVVHLAGAETIEGVKTFVPSPEVPVPSDAGGAANKGYVDQGIDGLATVASTGNYNDLVNRPVVTNLAAPGAIGASTPGPVNATVYTVNGTPLASGNLSDGALLARTSTTINGYPISSNVSLSASNLTPGALPNGTTATTQTGNDNSTKVATTQYVTQTLASPPGIGGTAPGTVNATAYAVNGTPLASGNLSDAATLARNNAANTFTANQLVNYSGGDGVSPLVINASASGLSNQHGLSVNLPSTGNRRAIGVVNGTDAMSWFSLNGNVNSTGNVGLELGLGGSSARDTFLYRSGAGTLSTAGNFGASGTLSAGATGCPSGSTAGEVCAPSLPISILSYGAKCDGATDDTAAIQSAFNVLSGKTLTFPPGKVCVVSAPLVISGVQTQWSIDGGSDATAIRSTATGVPIIQFSGQVGTTVYDWKITNLLLRYATQQSSGHAYGISFGDGSSQEQDYFDGEIGFVRFDNCKRGISNWGSGTVWGTRIHDIWSTGAVTGATVAYMAPGVGSVRMELENICASQNATEPIVNWNITCMGCSAKNIESDNQTNQVFYFGAWTGTLENLHMEAVTCTTPNTILVDLINSQVVLNGLTANANININPGAGNPCYLLGSDLNAIASIDGVYYNPTIVSGGSYVLHATAPTAGQSRYRLHNIWTTVPIFTTGEALLAQGSITETEDISGVSIVRAEYFNPAHAASSSANTNSDPLIMQGAYWNGTASALDTWTMLDVEGSGINPSSTVTLTHTGSSGPAALSVPNLVVSSLTAGAAPVCANGTNGALTTVGCTTGGGSYTLPTASSTVLGGVKPDGVSILNSGGAISATAASVGADAAGAAAAAQTNAIAAITAAVGSGYKVWSGHSENATTIAGQFGAGMTQANAITVKRLQLYVSAAAVSCTTYPVIAIYDSTASTIVGSVTLTSGVHTFDSGVLSVAVPAGDALIPEFSTAGVGCSTNASGTDFTAQYQ